MTVNCSDLLVWANEFSPNCETGFRTLISRSYYAAFHDCREFHSQFPPGLIPNKPTGSHETLIHQLSHPDPSNSQEIKTRMRKRAYALRDLKLDRVNADYELSASTISKSDATNARCTANRIVSY